MSDHRNHVPPAPRRHVAHDAPARTSEVKEQRVDEELRDDILKCLDKADFDASEVSVHVHNGVVTLRGNIDAAFKSRLLDLINGCGGLVMESQLQWR
jgi:osmotically-inducible protein OsmY